MSCPLWLSGQVSRSCGGDGSLLCPILLPTGLFPPCPQPRRSCCLWEAMSALRPFLWGAIPSTALLFPSLHPPLRVALQGLGTCWARPFPRPPGRQCEELNHSPGDQPASHARCLQQSQNSRCFCRPLCPLEGGIPSRDRGAYIARGLASCCRGCWLSGCLELGEENPRASGRLDRLSTEPPKAVWSCLKCRLWCCLLVRRMQPFPSKAVCIANPDRYSTARDIVLHRLLNLSSFPS